VAEEIEPNEFYEPKYYADACEIADKENPGFCDMDFYVIKFGKSNNYTKLEDELLGTGMHAEVYKGLTKDETPCVIKYIKPTDKKELRKEIKIYETLKNGPNIINIFDVF